MTDKVIHLFPEPRYEDHSVLVTVEAGKHTVRERMEKRSEAWFMNLKGVNRADRWLVAVSVFAHDLQRNATAIAPGAEDFTWVRYRFESDRLGGLPRREAAKDPFGTLEIYFLADGVPQEWEGKPSVDLEREWLDHLAGREPDYTFRFDIRCHLGTGEVAII